MKRDMITNHAIRMFHIEKIYDYYYLSKRWLRIKNVCCLIEIE